MDEQSQMQTNREEVQMSRRLFIRWLLGFSVVSTLGGVLAPIVGYLWPPARASSSGKGGRILVGTVDDFPLSNGKVVVINDKPVIVVNTEAGGLKAFSAICTHLACITYWHEQRQIIQCPCHDGRFNPLNGMVISGPPPRPLSPYELEIVNGEVYIGEVNGSIGPT